MKDLEEHKNTSCEYRLVHCDECDEDMSVKKYGKHVCLLHKEVQEIKTVLVDVKSHVTEMQEIQDQKLDELVTLVRNMTSKGEKITLSEAPRAITDNYQQQSGNILVLGGVVSLSQSNTVELYSVNKGTWTLLEPMLAARDSLTAHYYKDQVLVSGGCSTNWQLLNTIECLKSKDGSLSWNQSLAKLPFKAEHHKTVIIDDHLMVIGGRDKYGQCFNSIHKIQLSPPFTSTHECHMPHPLTYHAVESFGNDILIFGGSTGFLVDPVNNVWLYNALKKTFTPMLPLPVPVQNMATVKCGDDVLIIGGWNKESKVVNTMFKYNYKKSTCEQLPSMKYSRSNCAAVLSGNKVYVMGGFGPDQRKGKGSDDKRLSSMECFDLGLQVWEELAPMSEAKSSLAAVVTPANF